MIHIIFKFNKPFSDPSCPVDEGTVILSLYSFFRFFLCHWSVCPRLSHYIPECEAGMSLNHTQCFWVIGKHNNMMYCVGQLFQFLSISPEANGKSQPHCCVSPKAIFTPQHLGLMRRTMHDNYV